AGCDSIVTLKVTVSPNVTSSVDSTVCPAQLPFTWNGQNVTAAGTFTANLKNIAGCDSIVTLNLTVSANVTSTSDLTLCPAQLPYSWNGQSLTTGGTYTANLKNITGCDSIVTLNLAVSANVTSSSDLTLCPAQLPYSWNGQSLTTGGTYTANLKN